MLTLNVTSDLEVATFVQMKLLILLLTAMFADAAFGFGRSSKSDASSFD